MPYPGPVLPGTAEPTEDEGVPPPASITPNPPAASTGLTWHLAGMFLAPGAFLPIAQGKVPVLSALPPSPLLSAEHPGLVAVLSLPSTAHQTEEVATAELLKAFFWWRPPVLRD